MGDDERRSGHERRAAESKETLLRRLEEMEQADRRKNEFLAILSHELRNPIHAIRTNAWLLAQRAQDPETKEASAAIERQVSLLSKLLEDLLNVVKLSRTTTLELATHDARDLLRHAIDATRQSIDKRHHTLDVELAPEPLPVHVDGGRVEQALMNILENAAKYTDPGGVITASARRVLGRAVLSVRDTGIGIAAEDMPTLFELFKQGAAARARPAGGLGIGLHIASQMVRENGGHLEVRSPGVGLGSEFTITLPLHAQMPPEEELAEEEEPIEDEQPQVKPLTILVVDDNRDAADSLAKLLRTWGHEAWTAYDGLQAIDVAREKRPLVALVDIALPKISGYEVAQRLSRDQWGRTMTLVAVTGMGREDDKERATAAGFDEHLTKPIDYAVLQGILAKL